MIAILCPISAKSFNFEEFVKEFSNQKIVIFVKKGAISDFLAISDTTSFKIECIPKWDEKLIYNTIMEFHKNFSIKSLIAIDERDLEIAATIRSELQIDGLTIQETYFFRNKNYMKQRAKNLGISVPNFCLTQDIEEAEKFFYDNNEKIILKPVDGMGSIGVIKIESIQKLKEYFNNPIKSYLLEEYITADVYHIDGFVLDGKLQFCIPSKYIKNCFEFFYSGNVTSIQLDQNNEIFTRLESFAKLLLDKINIQKSYLFHLEVFADETDIKLCEIAARLGGGRIKEELTQMIGIDPNHLLVLEKINLEMASQIKPSFKYNYGFILLAPKKGVLLNMLKKDCIPCEDIKIFGKIGTYYSGAENSMHCVAAILVKGLTYLDCYKKLNTIEKIADVEITYSLD